MKHINIRVEGSVQGVWFRDSTRKMANELGIKGFVRNEPDGTVYIEAEGTEENLNQLVEWCHLGSEQSNVTGVEIAEGEIRNYNDFKMG